MLDGNRKGEVTDFNDKGCSKSVALTLLGIVIIIGAGASGLALWL